jgi:hypothetical protein
MSDRRTVGFRRARRSLAGVALGAVVTLGGVLGAFAHDEYGEFGEAEKLASGGAYEEYEYAYSPYPVYYEEDVYLYATGKEGEAQYYTYDGEWSEPYVIEEAPVKYQWDAAAVSINGNQYAFYAGEDGKYYHAAYDGSAWGGWEDVSGEYEFVAAPFAYDYAGDVWLYGVATDDYLYYKYWESDTGEWTEWAQVSADYTSGAYQPYAVTWNDYNNVFWTGEDGYVYWNRYSDESGEWTGEKQLPYEADEYTYAYPPYAVGYGKTDQLFAYAITEDGVPNWNTFSEDEGWSGWKPYDAEYPGTGYDQPYAYVYGDIQYVFITADDGHAYYATYDGEAHSDWTDLGENYAYQVATYEYDGDYYLTYTGENGYLYYKGYAAGEPEEEDDDY